MVFFNTNAELGGGHGNATLHRSGADQWQEGCKVEAGCVEGKAKAGRDEDKARMHYKAGDDERDDAVKTNAEYECHGSEDAMPSTPTNFKRSKCGKESRQRLRKMPVRITMSEEDGAKIGEREVKADNRAINPEATPRRPWTSKKDSKGFYPFNGSSTWIAATNRPPRAPIRTESKMAIVSKRSCEAGNSEASTPTWKEVQSDQEETVRLVRVILEGTGRRLKCQAKPPSPSCARVCLIAPRLKPPWRFSNFYLQILLVAERDRYARVSTQECNAASLVDEHVVLTTESNAVEQRRLERECKQQVRQVQLCATSACERCDSGTNHQASSLCEAQQLSHTPSNRVVPALPAQASASRSEERDELSDEFKVQSKHARSAMSETQSRKFVQQLPVAESVFKQASLVRKYQVMAR